MGDALFMQCAKGPLYFLCNPGACGITSGLCTAINYIFEKESIQKEIDELIEYVRDGMIKNQQELWGYLKDSDFLHDFRNDFPISK